ncbi:MAG TPA: CRTAC1 family protein [Nitrospiria bacterium]
MDLKKKSVKNNMNNLKSEIMFTDVTQKAGIKFIHENGGTGQYFYPETFGSGVCVIDYNADSAPDLVLINGNRDFSSLKKQKELKPIPNSIVLYHNNGNGTFSDRTQQAQIISELYGMGCSVGDYDNNGFQDLLVTGYEGFTLYHNQGKGSFEDVTQKAFQGKSQKGWATGSLWFDYDRDGDLDLFVGHYVQWSPKTDLWCTIDGKEKSFCGPEPYSGETNRLYQNRGDGTFQDVTKPSGLLNTKGKTLGVSMLDMDEDGWMDLVIANDMVPNFLYRNKQDGTFVEAALKKGLFVNERGLAKAGMGIDVADFENDGGPGILIGNFAHEQLSLFVRREKGVFVDESRNRGLAIPSHFFLTFGLFFFDFNLDGLLDIFTANGHVDRHASLISKGSTYQQRPLLFRQNKEKKFDEVGLDHGKALTRPVLGRGAVYLDYDEDGDLDIFLTENGGRPILYRNEGGNQNHWLRIGLVGTESNRDGIGALVKVKVGDQVLQAMVKTGSSYLSQSELPLTFGLGELKQAEWIEVQWPLGKVEKHDNIKSDQFIVFKEGKNIIKQIP